jgi:hypothetical protein
MTFLGRRVPWLVYGRGRTVRHWTGQQEPVLLVRADGSLLALTANRAYSQLSPSLSDTPHLGQRTTHSRL